MRMVSMAVLGALLVACGSDGGGGGGIKSTCEWVGGTGACNGGGCNNSVAVADRDLKTLGRVNDAEVGALLAAFNGDDFGPGLNAGAFVTLPNGATTNDITIQTTLGGTATTVESATGSALTVTPTKSDPANDYVSFITNAPFDGVQLVVNASGAGKDYLVFEFCGSATVE